jgi:hypothetical protein
MKKAASYLKQLFGIELHWKPWEDSAALPAFLRSSYTFYEVRMFGKSFLVLHISDNAPFAPSVLAKHQAYLLKSTPHGIIFVRNKMDAFLRQRLIENRISFITPFNQAYLPELGIDLREYFRASSTQETRNVLTPAAQAVFLHALQSPARQHTTSSLHAALGYSIMTLNRAINELSKNKLLHVNEEQWKKSVSFAGSKHSAWSAAQELLVSPLRRTEFVHQNTIATAIEHGAKLLQSGLAALAACTDLAEDKPSFALDSKAFTQLKTSEYFLESRAQMPDAVPIEVWHYNPRVISSATLQTVDPLSLFLSLKDFSDDRIQAALDSLMSEVINAWNK